MSRSADFERKSSAVSLSDMEMFIFPELLYALVLANIMSPRIWRWREDSWFKGYAKKKPYQRVSRLKQFIMDNYVFNLDLETWGLTTKQRELARFEGIVDADTLGRSNALFGYEGDKYYFDLDIRTHFGLDKYDSDVIPYWKTETVEAMDAFRHKHDIETGAGECVSLAALYAAALFVVAEIPLDDIYLMATPLHSQNFVDLDDGILTNNRRLVTKAMWFNGTALSAKARRALENERVTFVTHKSGWIHTLYDRATIAPERYTHFTERLRSFLYTGLAPEVLVNFLRHDGALQRCFQFRWLSHGGEHFIPAEVAFRYEHNSPYQLSDNTREKLMLDIEMEEFRHTPHESRVIVEDLEAALMQQPLDLFAEADEARLVELLSVPCRSGEEVLKGLRAFCQTQPDLPKAERKRFESEPGQLAIEPGMSRGEIEDLVDSLRGANTAADLAFYAFRDLRRTDVGPFLAAAFERNPVCIDEAKDLDASALVARVQEMENESIYDGPGRLAQPDEVWNYGRGDGVEKALMLANILHARDPEADIALEIEPDRCRLRAGNQSHEFPSEKNLATQTWQADERLSC